jgi:hypothetical protein
MGAARMFSAPFQQYFLCLGANGKIAIRPEIFTTEFFIFFLFISHGLILLPRFLQI